MDANTLVSAITAAAIALAGGKDADTIDFLGTVFSQFGDTLSTIAAQKDLCGKS